MSKQQLLTLARVCGETGDIIGLGNLVAVAGRDRLATFAEVTGAYHMGAAVRSMGL